MMKLRKQYQAEEKEILEEMRPFQEKLDLVRLKITEVKKEEKKRARKQSSQEIQKVVKAVESDSDESDNSDDSDSPEQEAKVLKVGDTTQASVTQHNETEEVHGPIGVPCEPV